MTFSKIILTQFKKSMAHTASLSLVYAALDFVLWQLKGKIGLFWQSG